MTIKIFDYEIKDGIADLVKNNSIAFTLSVKPHLPSDEEKAIIQKTIAEANPNQFDLFYLEAVLASVGWNKNDDVFDKLECWNARNTPVDKQFNFMHNEKDIIGHITSSRVLDFDGNVIPNSTEAEKVPDQFDIVVGSVLYKRWENPELQVRMDTLLEEIQQNLWCVSMECLFPHFDYAVITSDGSHKVVARNAETSFLTKHLRIYGGTGEYEDARIGRLLRNFAFSGKGLVDNPANPRSRIKSHSNIFLFKGISEEMHMSVTYTQEQYDALKKDLENAKAQLADVSKKEFDELKVSLASMQNDLNASKEVAKVKDETISKLEAKIAEVTKANDELNSQLSAIKAEQVKAARLAKLMSRDITSEKAESLISKFANSSDEMFDELVNALPAKSECKEPDKDDEEMKDKKGKGEDNSLEVETQKEDQAALAVTTEEKVGELRSKAVAWFGNVLRSTNKESK